MFAIDLISHLSVQYALPKSYSTARLAVNALSTLLSGERCMNVGNQRMCSNLNIPPAVLSVEERSALYPPTLPSLVRIARAFPPLVEDILALLVQMGKV